MHLASLLLAAAAAPTTPAPESFAHETAPGAGAVCAVARVADTVEVDLLELTKVKWEPGQDLPEEIRALDGKDVLITGVMHQDTGYDVKQFLLVTESCECAASPLPTHFVEVRLTSGKTSRKRGEMSFRGTFSVGPELDEDGFVESLYRLEGDFF